MTVFLRSALAFAVLLVASGLAGLPWVSAAPARAIPAAPASGTPSPSRSGPTGPAGIAPIAPDPSASGGGIASATDPLTTNGLSSELCRASPPDLSVRTRTNCAASGLSVSPVPTDHYAFDIHIDAPFPPGEDTAAIVFQDMLLSPLWTSLVWLIHALIVALEWCYAIDLLDSATIGGLSRPLAQAEQLFTAPWMVVVLSTAAVAIAYRGLVRRQVADSLADAATMAAMMLAGLAIIATPRETIGRLSALVNDASLGSLAAVSSGDPRQPDQALADGLQSVFDGSVQGPWCYLEFGDVSWCRSPGRLEHRLFGAAQRLAATDRQSAGCVRGGCPGPPGSKQASLAQEVPNVAAARTNGGLFLAFPANGPARNSINDPESLLHTLCGTYDATACSGPTAAEAEFRTASGTWPRAGGLLFIVIGVAGMLALLSFIGLRLIGAAVLSVFFLLLTPVAVLTPALGHGGRSVFRSWLERLLGAVLAKLVYSVFLGAVLLLVRLLQGMGSLGWWTQWLLVAAFWWTVFANRRRVFEFAMLGHRDMAGRGARMASSALANGLIIRRLTGRHRRSGPHLPGPPPPPDDPWPKPAPDPAPSEPPPDGPQPRPEGPAGSPAALGPFPWSGGPWSEGAESTGAAEGPWSWLGPGDAGADPSRRGGDDHAATAPAQLPRRLLAGPAELTSTSSRPADAAAAAARRTRLARLRDHEARARARGDARRAALLGARIHWLDRQADGSPALAPGAGLAPAAATAAAAGRPNGPRTPAEAEDFLDRQAALRRGVPPGPRADAARYRDYSQLSGLVGLGPDRYRGLTPVAARRARLAIDRELRRWEAHRGAEGGSDAQIERFRGPPDVVPRSAPRPTPIPRASPAAARARRARQFLGAVQRDRP